MALADRLIEEEGVCTWMYQDTAVPPVVTCGVGHALFAVENALVLPWDQPEAQVRADFAFVRSAPSGRVAKWYAQFTKARLTPEYIRQLLEADIEAAIVGVKRHFPTFDSFPASAQSAIQDLAFNLGPNFPRAWPHFKAAVLAGDWATAAAECHRKGISEARNKATAELLLAAAGPVLPEAA